jgi:hypothetical protein
MREYQTIGPAKVIGPLGEALTLDMLPPASPSRWTVRRKAEVVAAVSGGLLSFDDACKRYSLSVYEFTTWQRAVEPQRDARIARYEDQLLSRFI